MSNNFNVTFLGTSAASLSPNSSTSALLVEIDQDRILIDAGIGALRQLRRIKVSPDDIDLILITHWHLDHFAGLPAVIRAKRKSTQLSIFGPAIPLFARSYLAFLFCPPGKMFKAITENFSQTYQGFSIQAIPNSHTIDSYGWVIKEQPQGSSHEGRKIVISGDTRPTEAILNAALEADLLIHEATYLARDSNTALANLHSTASEAAELAVKAGVGALALTHIPPRYSHLEIQIEAQKIFPKVLVPSPLDTIRLGPSPEIDSLKIP